MEDGGNGVGVIFDLFDSKRNNFMLIWVGELFESRNSPH